jgi:hypothetical protein
MAGTVTGNKTGHSWRCRFHHWLPDPSVTRTPDRVTASTSPQTPPPQLEANPSNLLLDCILNLGSAPSVVKPLTAVRRPGRGRTARKATTPHTVAVGGPVRAWGETPHCGWGGHLSGGDGVPSVRIWGGVSGARSSADTEGPRRGPHCRVVTSGVSAPRERGRATAEWVAYPPSKQTPHAVEQ